MPGQRSKTKFSKENQPSKASKAAAQALDHPELLSLEMQQAILDEAARRFGVRNWFDSLEDMICSEDGFGIATLTPLQRAICRIADGKPLAELVHHEHVVAALGVAPEILAEFEVARKINGYPLVKELMVIAGIRTFKSLLLAAEAIMATQRIDISRLSGGEIPRYSIISTSIDSAKVVLQHLLGALQKPKFATLRVDKSEIRKWSDWNEVIKESSSDLVGSEFLWHPSGRPVEIRVVAGKRAGASGASRWSAGCGLDEAAKMVGLDEGVVNYEDTRRVILGRLLPGAQIFSTSSPWRAEGPVFDIVHEWWGHLRPSMIVFKAPGPHMNPIWWTPERCEELKQRDATAYQMDVLGDFADAGESLIPQALIAKNVRVDSQAIPWVPGHEYSAAMDPATRGNAWTLVVADKHSYVDESGILRSRKRVCLAVQWIGSQLDPLRPRVVLGEISDILKSYHLDWVYTDQWSADAIKDLAMESGLAVIIEAWTSANAVTAYLGLRVAMEQGECQLPNDPVLLRDIRLVHRVVNTRGPGIHLATTVDGRHCDYAPVIVRSITRWLANEEVPKAAPGTPAAHQAMLDEWRQKAYDKVANKNKDWWAKGPERVN